MARSNGSTGRAGDGRLGRQPPLRDYSRPPIPGRPAAAAFSGAPPNEPVTTSGTTSDGQVATASEPRLKRRTTVSALYLWVLKPLSRAFLWLLSIVGALVLGWYVPNYFNRPKPSVEIASIDIRGGLPPSTKLQPSLELNQLVLRQGGLIMPARSSQLISTFGYQGNEITLEQLDNLIASFRAESRAVIDQGREDVRTIQKYIESHQWKGFTPARLAEYGEIAAQPGVPHLLESLKELLDRISKLIAPAVGVGPDGGDLPRPSPVQSPSPAPPAPPPVVPPDPRAQSGSDVDGSRAVSLAGGHHHATIPYVTSPVSLSTATAPITFQISASSQPPYDDFPDDDLVNRRREMLESWSHPGNAILPSLAGMIMWQTDFIRTELKAPKYTSFPNWPPDRFIVPLPGTVPMSLGPPSLDNSLRVAFASMGPSAPASASASAPMVYQTLPTWADEAVRKVWLYLDRHVVRALISRCRDQIDRAEESTKQVADALEKLRDERNPKHVHVSVVISNHGASPLILRSSALLALKYKQQTPYAMELVQSSPGQGSDAAKPGAIVVAGGTSSTVDLVSKQSVDEIGKDMERAVGFKGGGLVRLFELSDTECHIYFSRMDQDSTEGTLSSQKLTYFGPPEGKELKTLRESIK